MKAIISVVAAIRGRPDRTTSPGGASAEEADRLGLVNRVVPTEELDAEGQRWAAKFLQLDAAALMACKAFFNDSAYMHPDAAANHGVSFLADFNTSR